MLKGVRATRHDTVDRNPGRLRQSLKLRLRQDQRLRLGRTRLEQRHGLFQPFCANLSIDSNRSIGVAVRDGGVVKLEGSPAADGCPAANVIISNNGDYGMLAEGGGLGFLYRALGVRLRSATTHTFGSMKKPRDLPPAQHLTEQSASRATRAWTRRTARRL
jgi:hypothetical protein